MRSACGALDLRFTPCGRHTERLNAGLIASDFRQDFGYFSGVIQPAGRAAMTVRDIPGFCEDQFARW